MGFVRVLIEQLAKWHCLAPLCAARFSLRFSEAVVALYKINAPISVATSVHTYRDSLVGK